MPMRPGETQPQDTHGGRGNLTHTRDIVLDHHALEQAIANGRVKARSGV
jgi:hypothetical protein